MQIDRPDYTRSTFRQLNAPVDERPLWPDTGNNIASKEPRITSPLRHNAVSIHLSGNPQQLPASPQSIILDRFLAQRQPTAKKHRRRAPDYISGNEINSSCRAIRPKIDPTPYRQYVRRHEGQRSPRTRLPHNHHHGDQRPGAFRDSKQAIMRKVSRNASATRVPCTMRYGGIPGFQTGLMTYRHARRNP